MTAAKRQELLALAKKIDRDEKDEIVAMGRVVFERFELVKRIVEQIKAIREQRGISVTDVGEKSGIGKANVSRLENGQTPNPTLDTLYRYAHAVGVQLHLAIAPIGAEVDVRPIIKLGLERSDRRKVAGAE